jgi:hypothetical protein
MSGSRRSNAELLRQLEEKNPLLGLGCSYSPYPVRLWIQDIDSYYPLIPAIGRASIRVTICPIVIIDSH